MTLSVLWNSGHTKAIADLHRGQAKSCHTCLSHNPDISCTFETICFHYVQIHKMISGSSWYWPLVVFYMSKWAMWAAWIQTFAEDLLIRLNSTCPLFTFILNSSPLTELRIFRRRCFTHNTYNLDCHSIWNSYIWGRQVSKPATSSEKSSDQ